MHDALAIFTSKPLATILEEGGSQSWVLDRAKAARCSYAVVCRNAHNKADWAPTRRDAPEDHGAAFLVGKISGVEPSTNEDHPDRFKVAFDEYAEISIPDVWKGWRNPIKYASLDELGIDLTQLEFRKMPDAQQKESKRTSRTAPDTGPMTIERAKRELSAAFGVPADAIEIVIRG